MNNRSILNLALMFSVCLGGAAVAKSDTEKHSGWVLNARSGPRQPLAVPQMTLKDGAPAPRTAAGHYEWRSVRQDGPRGSLVARQFWVSNTATR